MARPLCWLRNALLEQAVVHKEDRDAFCFDGGQVCPGSVGFCSQGREAGQNKAVAFPEALAEQPVAGPYPKLTLGLIGQDKLGAEEVDPLCIPGQSSGVCRDDIAEGAGAFIGAEGLGVTDATGHGRSAGGRGA